MKDLLPIEVSCRGQRIHICKIRLPARSIGNFYSSLSFGNPRLRWLKNAQARSPRRRQLIEAVPCDVLVYFFIVIHPIPH
jgi:hypothetical protein